MGFVAAIEVALHTDLLPCCLIHFQTFRRHIKERHMHFFRHLTHAAHIVFLRREDMTALLIDLAVLKIDAADRRHQYRFDTHLSGLKDIFTQVRLIRRVGVRTAHISQRIFSRRTQFGILDIYIFALAFLIIMRELDDEIVAGLHLLLDGRP